MGDYGSGQKLDHDSTSERILTFQPANLVNRIENASFNATFRKHGTKTPAAERRGLVGVVVKEVVVPRVGVEPTWALSPPDFESGAYTNFATPAGVNRNNTKLAIFIKDRSRRPLRP